jgi:tetratricopeptide (TPR) repeat protein
VAEANLSTLSDDITKIIPIINQEGNKEGASVKRAMITLYAASHITNFREKAIEIGDCRYFSPYQLSQIAADKGFFGERIKFDKSRTSIRDYKKCEKKKYTKFLSRSKLLKIKRTDSGVQGTLYLAITNQGNRYCKDLLSDLLYSKQRQNMESDKSKAGLIPRSHKTVFRGEKTIFVEGKEGRKRQIQELKRIMRKTRGPISLVGEGGIGKSSLAFRLINSCGDLYEPKIQTYLEQGVTFGSFISDIARQLPIFSSEFYKEGLETRRQLLLEALARAKHPLIFADNYESISKFSDNNTITNDSKRITSFLESVPSNTRIILTSRNKFNLAGECVRYVSGLIQDESVELFVQISKRHFTKEPSKDVIKEIKKISHELWGHPLSIKLLAGSYQGGGVSELRYMASNMLMNTTNEMEEQKRLTSINNCFDYSFDRLSDENKTLLLDLCLFKSPILNTAVNFIFHIDEKRLLDLFNRGFIRRVELEEDPDIQTPYRLYDFHPVIKKYLEEKPNEKRLFLQTELSEAYASYYGLISMEIFWTVLGEVDRSDFPILKALNFPLVKAFELGIRQRENDFEQAFELIKSPELKPFVAAALSAIMKNVNLFDRSLYYANKRLEIDISIGDLENIGADYSNLGDLFVDVNDLDRSLEYHQKALDTLIQLKNEESLASEYCLIGNIFRLRGDPDKSLEYQQKAYHLVFRRIGKNFRRREILAMAYSNIAIALSDKGDLQGALNYNRKALKLNKKSNNILGMRVDYNNIGNNFFKMGGLGKALTYYSKALGLDQQIDNKKFMIIDFENIADVLEFKGDIKKSIEYKEKARNLELEFYDMPF